MCVACPSGHYSDGEHACQPCGVGTAALPQLIFNSWDSWDNRYVYTDCEGDDCTNHGWELASTYVHTGRYPGKRVDIWLGLVVDVGSFGGAVTFTYSLVHGSRMAALQFLIDGYYGGLFRTDVDRATVTYKLEPGEHVLVWNFHRADVNDEHPDAKAMLYMITVDGVVDGGASRCVTCPPGYYQPQAEQTTCLACNVGFISSIGNSTAVCITTLSLSLSLSRSLRFRASTFSGFLTRFLSVGRPTLVHTVQGQYLCSSSWLRHVPCLRHWFVCQRCQVGL